MQSTPLCPCTQPLALFLKHLASQAGLGARLWPWYEQLHQGPQPQLDLAIAMAVVTEPITATDLANADSSRGAGESVETAALCTL